MNYRIIGGEHLGNDRYTSQFLVGDDEAFCMMMDEVIRKVENYDKLLVERNKLRNKLWKIKEELKTL